MRHGRSVPPSTEPPADLESRDGSDQPPLLGPFAMLPVWKRRGERAASRTEALQRGRKRKQEDASIRGNQPTTWNVLTSDSLSEGDVMDAATDFDAFYNATNRRVLHQMYAMTGNLADAQDVTQEAYARAWQRWKHVRHTDSPEAWVRTVAWRIAASRWRKTKNGIAAMTRHGVPDHTAAPSPDHVALITALKQIPEAQRRAIVLHHLVGMPVEAIAHETGSPPGTVKARLARGRAALAKLLRDEPTIAMGGETP